MSDTARRRLKEQLRQQHIQKVFKLQRARFICGNSNTIFNELSTLITDNINQPTDIDIVNRLIALLEQYPHHENTYILIGNYMVDHRNCHQYLMPRFFGIDRQTWKLENYFWVMAIALSVAEHCDRQMLDDYDVKISEIIAEYQNYQELRQAVEILRMLIGFEDKLNEKEYMPWLSIEQLEIKLQTLTPESLTIDLKSSLVEVVECLADRICDHEVFDQYMTGYLKIALLSLSQFPTHRQNSLDLLKQVSIRHQDSFEKLCQTELGCRILQQLFYLLENAPKLHLYILQIFENLTLTFEFRNLVSLLNSGLHVYVLKAFECRDSDCVLKALKIIRNVLAKFSSKGEDQLVDKVLQSMEERGFDGYLRQLVDQRHDQQTEQILSEIIDDYYSEGF